MVVCALSIALAEVVSPTARPSLAAFQDVRTLTLPVRGHTAAAWVPLSARCTSETGSAPVRREVRFARNAEGATRNEVEYAPDTWEVKIRNFADHREYGKDVRGNWLTASTDTNPPVPERATFERPGYSLQDTKFGAYEAILVEKADERRIVVPALSYFAVEVSIPGRHDRCYDVVVGPQSADRFSPPPNTKVKTVASVADLNEALRRAR